MTSGAALVSAAGLLGTRLDAELLLAHILDCSRASLHARDERALTPEEQGDFEQLVARRMAGEPLAYLTGTKEFWSLELEVTPDVLVPRPETELLVEWILSSPAVLPAPRRRGATILDVGTGSGAIALALARELPEARILATDISGAALRVARANAALHKISTVKFEQADGLPKSGEACDVIVSNPPYIAAGDPHLAALKHEPQLALTDGADGLSILRRIIAAAPARLAPQGWLLVEHGFDQGEAVREIFRRAGLHGVETRRDLAGHERATGGFRP